MSMTLLQLCQDALEGLDGIAVPTTIINNSDPTAITLKRAAMQTGRELARNNWQSLLTAASFVTESGTATYARPADFGRYADGTFYNVTEYQTLYGPHNPRSWAELTRGIMTSTALYNFRVAGNNIVLTPTPSSVQTIGYDYYSRYYCTSSGGTAQENWAADADLSRLPDDLVSLGIRYRFLQRKGEPYGEDKADYVQALDNCLWDDTPKAAIDVSGVPRARSSNIPDSNWG
jgi:hypothetical protein